MSLINQPCAVSRPGVPHIVTPRRRVVLGGCWAVESNRRVYHLQTRWACEWVQTWTNGDGLTRIVVRSELFAEYELTPVAEAA